MDILYVIFLSVFSLVVLFLLTKLIGYRQMSEMSMFDYISGITIGSIAAEMATAPDSSFLEPLTAMIVYGLLTAFLAFITEKNMKIRRFISGSPYILFNDGHQFSCKIGASSCLTVRFEFIAEQGMAASNLYHGWKNPL